MAWTSPMTFVADTVLTAAQLNTHLRDNLLETAPAKADGANQHFVSTGANSIVNRFSDQDFEGSQATISDTSYGDPSSGTAGPSVEVDTGTHALVFWRAEAQRSGLDPEELFIAPEVSGATSRSPADAEALRFIQENGSSHTFRQGHCQFTYMTSLTGGTNTFTLKYKKQSGADNWFVFNRQIYVYPL